MNQQREVLYEQRRRILRNESLRETINEMIDKACYRICRCLC